jgi:hypothetical protein
VPLEVNFKAEFISEHHATNALLNYNNAISRFNILGLAASAATY